MIERIIRTCNVSPGLQLVRVRYKEKDSWVMVISPHASDKIKRSGIRQANKLKIPYEITVNGK